MKYHLEDVVKWDDNINMNPQEIGWGARTELI